MMAMTTYRYDLGGDPDICFVQCAKRPSELVFRRPLEHMASRVPTIKLHYVVGEDDPYGAWTGYRGSFNQLMLGLMAPTTWSARSTAAARSRSCSRSATC